MTANPQDFIRHARDKGLDHATIRSLLVSAGWKERDIASAIASECLDVPVPKPVGGHGAREAFLYLLTFASLYITVSSIIALAFTYLDYVYPDPAWGPWYAEAALSTVRYAIAAIIVGFPLFLLLTAVVDRAAKRDSDDKVHPAANWLTYLTLFLAAAMTVGDLIALLYYFLDGALTTRFLLKVAVLLVISILVLAYYISSIWSVNRRGRSDSLRRWFAGAALLVVAGTFVAGFDMAGSPFTVRLRRLDEKRVEDLRAIHQTVQQMVTRPDKNSNTVTVIRDLPKSIKEIAAYQQTRDVGRKLDVVDPQTGEEYSYTVAGDKTYELCANFSLAREKQQDLFWNHPSGKHCFKFNAGSPP